jgi:hypothetical protein
MGGNAVEPSAEMRQAAHMIRESFVPLLAERLSEQQALVIVGQILTASIGK